MDRRYLVLLLPLAALFAASQGIGQGTLPIDSPVAAERELAIARQQGEVARKRAEALEKAAAQAVAAANKTAQESAALAARVQQAEAEIAANQARLAVVDRQRDTLRASLARKQQPLVELTGALQRLSRRPPILSLFYPGSLREAVYLRATLDAMLPEVERRTAGVRADLERGRALVRQMEAANAAVRKAQVDRNRRRTELAALETRQRLASRAASGAADREAERALALAEQAGDLAQLVARIGEAGALRQELAALPGPIMRPPTPQTALVTSPEATPSAAASSPVPYLLPAAGQLVTGFGESGKGRLLSRGIQIAPRDAVQAVAPGAGRVAFAGPYRGYGNIVIIEHAGGWTSLITGLAKLDTQVGAQLVAGSPLGQTGGPRQPLTLELRHDGQAVNPLEHYRP